MTDRIFINYRRGEDSGFAQALFIRLEQAFVQGRLFMDVDSIAPGTDFVRHLEAQVAQCDVLLALIGGSWLEAADGEGRRRLDDADDFVRIEIASALRQDKRVIPVLLHDTKMPTADRLPEELRPLVRRQAVRLTHERFRADAEGLIRALQEAGGGTTVVTSPNPTVAAAPIPAAQGDAVSRVPDRQRSQPSVVRSGIAGRVEAVVARYEATNVGVISLLCAVLLIFGSYVAGVVDVEYQAAHKQVGFLWAPNWSLNYLILLVTYNCLFCFLVMKADEMLRGFHARGVVVSNGDKSRGVDDLIADWQVHLRGMAPIVWFLSLGVPSVCFEAWFNDCYLPLRHNDLLGNTVDWALIGIVQPEVTSRAAELVFTAISYGYLCVASWIYLFVLAYAATFAAYLAKLSRGAGAFRMVFRSPEMTDGMRDLLQRIFGMACLGFLSAYTGRVQATYLMGPDRNIFQFMFSTELDLLHGAAPGPATVEAGKIVTSAWMSWPVFIYAAVIFGLTILLLQAAYVNARAYSLRQAASSDVDREAIERSAAGGFWRSVAPTLGQWVIVVVLMAASLAFPMTGSLLVAGVLCIAVPAALRWRRSVAEMA